MDELISVGLSRKKNAKFSERERKLQCSRWCIMIKGSINRYDDKK
mgnify:CR=1 FL=1